jgi:hypothetical protein
MSSIKRALLGSTVVLMTIGLAQSANAQSNEGDDQSSYCINNPDKCGAGQQYKKPRSDEGYSDDQEVYSKKRKYQEEDQTSDDSDQPRRKRKYQESDQAEDQSDQTRVKQAERDWKYDAGRHKRRRHKDDEFRFYFNRFWYHEP